MHRSLFLNKVTGLRQQLYWTGDSDTGVFKRFAKFLRTPFYRTPPVDCFYRTLKQRVRSLRSLLSHGTGICQLGFCLYSFLLLGAITVPKITIETTLTSRNCLSLRYDHKYSVFQKNLKLQYNNIKMSFLYNIIILYRVAFRWQID